jgi:hypothetical protein
LLYWHRPSPSSQFLQGIGIAPGREHAEGIP